MKNAIIFTLVVLFFTTCKKDEGVSLPEISHVGANTFGCKINGEIFSVYGDASLNWSHQGITFIPISNGPWFIKGNLAAPKSDVVFNVSYTGDGTYILNQHPENEAKYHNYAEVDYGASTEYPTDSTHVGQITITYDGKIVSGTFNFDAVNSQGKLVHITDGRFDLRQTK